MNEPFDPDPIEHAILTLLAERGPGRRRHRASIAVDAGCETGGMTDSTLKSTLRRDLHEAIRSQDKVRSATTPGQLGIGLG